MIEATPEELEEDLRPFRLLHPSVGSLMVAHVAYPALGSRRPATLSPEIVTALLRDRWGFEGLVATDAMIMSGVGEEGERAAVDAMRAGCDVILYPADLQSTIAALAREADADPQFAARIESAAGRSARLLDRFAGLEPARRDRPPGVDPPALELAIQTIVDRVGQIRGWSRDAPTAVVAISDDPDVGPPAGREGPLGSILANRLMGAGWRISAEGAPGDAGPPSEASQAIVVLAATPRGWKGHGGVSPAARERVRAAIAGAPRSLLVLLGHARWIDDLGCPALGAWSTESLMEHAAAAWLDRRLTTLADPSP